MLHVCVNAETWFWCDPFSIDDDGIIVRVVATNSSNLKLIIKVKALSNVQKQVSLINVFHMISAFVFLFYH